MNKLHQTYIKLPNKRVPGAIPAIDSTLLFLPVPPVLKPPALTPHEMMCHDLQCSGKLLQTWPPWWLSYTSAGKLPPSRAGELPQQSQHGQFRRPSRGIGELRFFLLSWSPEEAC